MIRHRFIRDLLRLAAIPAFLLFGGFPGLLWGQMSITGDEISADTETGEQIVRGTAQLTDGPLLLLADELRRDIEGKMVRASGNVRLTRGSLRILASELEVNLETGHFRASDFTAGRWPLYLEGEELAGTLDEITLENVVATLGEPGPGRLSLESPELTIRKGARIESEEVVGRLFEVPVFWAPGLTQDIDDAPLEIGLDGGYSGDLGAFLHGTILWQSHPGLFLGAEAGAYSERGLLAGPTAHYNTSGPFAAKGLVRSGYIHDVGDRGLDREGVSIGAERYFLDFEHRQDFPQNWRLTGRASFWSDSEVTRDFAEDLFENNQEPDTFLEASHTGENTVLTLFARLEPNDFQSYPERLPEVRFESLPTPVAEFQGVPLLFGYQAGYARLRGDNPAGAGSFTSNRLHLGYTLDAPWAHQKWLSVTPTSALFTTGYYDPVAGARDPYFRVLGQLGLDIEALAHGQWDYENPVWGIAGIRHTLRPKAQYRWVPEADAGQRRIPGIDLPSKTNYMRPINLSDLRSIDQIDALNLLRFGVENVVETRSEQGGIRELARIDLFQDLLFATGPGEETWDRTYSRIELNPAHWLSLQLFGSWQTSSMTLAELNSRLAIRSGDIWSLGLRTAKRSDAYEQYFIDASYKLNERFRIFAEARLDPENDRIPEHGYYLATRAGFPWAIIAGVIFREDARREEDFSLRFSIELLEF